MQPVITLTVAMIAQRTGNSKTVSSTATVTAVSLQGAALSFEAQSLNTKKLKTSIEFSTYSFHVYSTCKKVPLLADLSLRSFMAGAAMGMTIRFPFGLEWSSVCPLAAIPDKLCRLKLSLADVKDVSFRSAGGQLTACELALCTAAELLNRPGT